MKDSVHQFDDGDFIRKGFDVLIQDMEEQPLEVELALHVEGHILGDAEVPVLLGGFQESVEGKGELVMAVELELG